MEALEELALSYDGKDKIIETLETEKQSLTKELDVLQVNKETPPTQTTPIFIHFIFNFNFLVIFIFFALLIFY